MPYRHEQHRSVVLAATTEPAVIPTQSASLAPAPVDEGLVWIVRRRPRHAAFLASAQGATPLEIAVEWPVPGAFGRGAGQPRNERKQLVAQGLPPCNRGTRSQTVIPRRTHARMKKQRDVQKPAFHELERGSASTRTISPRAAQRSNETLKARHERVRYVTIETRMERGGCELLTVLGRS